MNRFNSLPQWAQILIGLVIIGVFGIAAYNFGYNLGHLLGSS